MYEILVFGVVQGVGFRPYFYNEAIKEGLRGFVQNTGECVRIVTEDLDKVKEILKRVPVLARVDRIEIVDFLCDEVFENFEIRQSESGKFESYSCVPCDLDLCEKCLYEMRDKSNFRYGYFFISCTDCGPRFSILNRTPYDRENTSLCEFEMCEKCRHEFESPENRRYHAQTIACKDCGPVLSFFEDGVMVENCDPVLEIMKRIKQGEVVAIKGVGGFHLVCKIDACDKLKKIIGRYDKPFALMAKDVDVVRKYVRVSDRERDVLLSRERPVVLLEKHDREALKTVSELSSLGFMLPYSGVHYLLFEHFDEPLIFTSSNLPSRPISVKKEEQFVSCVLDFNREIVNSVDDSIVKVVEDKTLILRRSRGFVLSEFEIGSNYFVDSHDFLCVGAEMKNTFCIKKENKLILSEHIGNTYNLENFESFKRKVYKLKEFTSTEFEEAICDKNFEFNTYKFAKDNFERVFEVQHHVAHAFSVAFEYDLDDFLAIVCDGTGYGEDGEVWGGEVFHNDERIGHIESFALIGGDAANREPLRVLVAILKKFLSDDEILSVLSNYKEKELRTYFSMFDENFNCIRSSSCSRVLDAMSVLLGFCDVNSYEGRCAMMFESNSMKSEMFFEPIVDKNVLMITPVFKFAIENLGKIPSSKIAWFLQEYIAKGLFMIAKNYSSELPLVFSGGVAYNRVISCFLIKKGVILNSRVPCGDGGISLGQAAYRLFKVKRYGRGVVWGK